MAIVRRFGEVILAAALAFSIAPAAAEPNFPALTGRVVDDAGLLNEADKQTIAAELEALEEKSSDQLVVVTLHSLQGYAIEDFGYRLGRYWGIGTEKLNNGVLLIVAPNERKVRVEVGTGLESTLTDALSKVVIENAILPRFREGDFAGGIKNGVRDISLVLTGDATEVEARAKARKDADPAVPMIFMILWLAIFLWIFYTIWRSASYAPGAVRRSGGPVFIPGPGWGGGGHGGRGGGFSGGGGSFGGGGASGGW